MEKRYGSEPYADKVSDIKVWQRLREGNIRALKTLFLRHHGHLYSYAIKLSGDRFLARDCVHDLFLRIWDRREHLGEVTSVKSYLWISLRRDLLKTMDGNKLEVLTADMVEYSPVIYFNSEEFIVRDERKRECATALAKALNQLPPRQREAIFLKYFNGMGYDEMEQIMSISYQTARNYVHDGVQTLKDYFDENAEKLIPYVFSIILFFLLI